MSIVVQDVIPPTVEHVIIESAFALPDTANNTMAPISINILSICLIMFLQIVIRSQCFLSHPLSIQSH